MEEKDLFTEKLKEKLEGHSLPVSDELWGKIESRLPVQRPKRLALPLLRLAGVAAAAAVLLLILLPLFTPQDEMAPDKEQMFARATAENIADLVAEKQPAVEESGFDKLTDLKNKESVKIITEHSMPKSDLIYADVEDKDSSQESGPVVNEQENAKEIGGEEIRKEEEQKEDKRQEQSRGSYDSFPGSLNDPVDIPVFRTKKKKGKIMLAALGATSGANSTPGAVSGAEYAEFGNDHSQPLTMDIPYRFHNIRLDDIQVPQKTYLPPVTLGINISYYLTENLSLGTGISYSYLRTLYSHANQPGNRADLQLHYIGVPLYLSQNLFSSSAWNIYVSAGGKIEKGVRGLYRQNSGISGDGQYTTPLAINGVQWSLQGAVGVGYKLSDYLNLFAEPQIAYYFENGQPESIRSEFPVAPGVSVGLRIEL